MLNKMSRLRNVLTPPNVALDYDEKWLKRNESILRIQFPRDFVEFGKRYGSGNIRSAYSWEVWSPFRSSYPLIVLEFSRVWNIYKEAMEIDDVPFGIFPEVGGILPFACTCDNDWVCWITDGEPDSWRVVDMYNYERGGYEVLDKGFSDYFHSVLTRDIVLERHQGGESWEVGDLRFEQEVFADQDYLI